MTNNHWSITGNFQNIYDNDQNIHHNDKKFVDNESNNDDDKSVVFMKKGNDDTTEAQEEDVVVIVVDNAVSHSHQERPLDFLVKDDRTTNVVVGKDDYAGDNERSTSMTTSTSTLSPTINIATTMRKTPSRPLVGTRSISSSCHSISTHGSSSSNNNSKSIVTSNEGTIERNMKLVEQETKLLSKIRIGLLLFIVIVAIFATFGVYYFSYNNEVEQYQSNFDANSNKVISSIQTDMYQKMQALHSFSTILTLKGIDENATWPFVTVENSAHYFDSYLNMIDAACLLVMPVIASTSSSSSDTSIRYQWEQYAIENQDWIDKELHTRNFFTPIDNGNKSYHNSSDYNHTLALWNEFSQLNKFGNIPISIHTIDGNDTTAGPYVVPWQFTPVIEMREIVNYNYLTDPEFAEEFISLQQGMATMSCLHHMINNNDQNNNNKNHDTSNTANLGLAEQFEYTMLQNFIEAHDVELPYTADEPMSYIRYPVVDNFADHVVKPSTIAILSAGLYWKTFLVNQLPDHVKGLICVISETKIIHDEVNGTTSYEIHNAVTYRMDGFDATWIGLGDLHDPKYDDMKQEFVLSAFDQSSLSSSSQTVSSNKYQKGYIGAHLDDNLARYTIMIYPSSQMESEYVTSEPIIYAMVMLLIFVFTALIFSLYNSYVEQRQKKIMATAMKTNAVVNSIFPSNVRDRIINNIHDTNNLDHNNSKDLTNHTMTTTTKDKQGFYFNTKKNNNGTTMNFNESMKSMKWSSSISDAIADFYPEVTICFSDLCGFTAYCSQRQPTEVFLLLETVFGSFDKIGLRLGVYKVESVGDCYVSACGLPEKRKDHALTMAKFARLCLNSLPTTLSELETILGPGTYELRHMRFGLNSGSVTAGVVRGQNARFQLFGDAVNTASRMESTGRTGQIQVSTSTAEHLIAAGKKHWLKQRDDKVIAKGKGELITFWLLPIRQSKKSLQTHDVATSRSIENISLAPSDSAASVSCGKPNEIVDESIDRLVKWNVDILLRILKDIARKRSFSKEDNDHQSHSIRILESELIKNELLCTMTIDEVKETIDFPCIDDNVVEDGDMMGLDETISFDEDVTSQLSQFIQAIAGTYRNNSFHNFDHASAVTMSVTKLLSRIVATSSSVSVIKLPEEDDERTMHDHIYRIASDPLTRFACVFAAIIHDCDHYGVPNAQLVNEGLPITHLYDCKSVAEQNSIDIAFTILMDERYQKLRSAIYSTTSEFIRFRQLVVNGKLTIRILLECLRNQNEPLQESNNRPLLRKFPIVNIKGVIATDIVNKDLKELRNARWDRAFSSNNDGTISQQEDINRKVTIIIEHLIQASDVAHTMQHWHIYRKWNECYFKECCHAYENGRGAADPASYWYEGELKFFDYYIIPLAKKLKDCGVFGVSSDEYLDYALRNRQEWENKGQDIVAEMVERLSPMVTLPLAT